MNITTTTTAVIEAFHAEFLAADKTDAALRTLFAAVYADNRSQSAVIKDAKAAATGLDSVECKVRCLPTSAPTATACSIVGEALSSYDDDMLGMFDLRGAWSMAAAIANEAKHGGGKAALVDLFASDAETLSDWVAMLDRLDRQVKAARRKAEAAPKAPKADADQQEDGEGEGSSESESVADILALLTAANGPVGKAASMRASGQALTAESEAAARALVAHLDTILAPASVTVSESVVSVNA